MQLLLSCAKDMAEEVAVRPLLMTKPAFEQKAGENAIQMSQYSIEELQKLLRCNESIAVLNKKRYMEFFDEGDKVQAALAYVGMAYRHLKAGEWNDEDCGLMRPFP